MAPARPSTSSTVTTTGRSTSRSPSLSRPEADRHLPALQVARRPVVEDRETGGYRPAADDRGDLELVVELLRPVG